MHFSDAEAQYNAWLARQVSLDSQALLKKQKKQRENPFSFLRATFYRWIELWPALASHQACAPIVPSVGDIHLENFGIWRESTGRLVWGVNDLDEACYLPYTHDLIRLAVSATLTKPKKFDIPRALACQQLWEGYQHTIQHGPAAATPLVLESPGLEWLLGLTEKQLATTTAGYYDDELKPGEKMQVIPATDVPSEARAALLTVWPEPIVAEALTWYKRTSGTGSLGRPRFAAAGLVGGSPVVRVVRALVPSAYYVGTTSAPSHTRQLLASSIRAADPDYRVLGAWIVRRIAPDGEKLELKYLHPEFLPHLPDLLAAMGRELANLHLGGITPTALAALQKHVASQKSSWLEDCLPPFLDAIDTDFSALPPLPAEGNAPASPK